ncbi:hypothetical protein DPMN_110381 [Dreissena polymorpha]|uniref:Uncharacterized protein n=1 Tax=Dreissena polymorpha TaxID=45954 RepID=A0A9D4KCG5_DREPO|nr:hypothetical protein DPMN_110381 [Dreissena polymorpha]
MSDRRLAQLVMRLSTNARTACSNPNMATPIVIKKLNESNSIILLGDITACMKEVVKEATRFVSLDMESLIQRKCLFGQPD